MKYSYRKRIVSMLMACFLILSSLMPSLQVFSADKAVVHAETASSEDALGLENPNGETYTEGETTVEEVAEEDTVTEEAANSNDTTSSNDSVNTDSTANKENKIYTEIKEKVKQSEEELKLADLARQGFYAVMSEDTDVAEVAVFSSSDESEIEVEVATETDAEEGLEVLESYTFGERDEKSEETLWVKADQGEDTELLPGESLSVYTVSDEKVEDVIIEDIAEEDELCEIDNEVTGIALVKDTGYRHLTFEVRPEDVSEEDESDDRVVMLDGMMPKEASAEAVDVTEVRSEIEAEEQSENALQNDASQTDADDEASVGDASEEYGKVIAAYDITINNGDEEYQPGEERPIAVEIIDSRIKADADLQLWHIKDDGTKEQVTDFTVEDGKVSFVAVGFSIYEIYEGLTPYTPSAERITDPANLIGEGTENGFILYYGNKIYITNQVNSKNALVEENDDITKAAFWHFEKEENENKYYIYTYVSGVKKYLNHKSGNLIELADNKTAFELSHDSGTDTDHSDEKFYIRKSGADLWLQHSRSGNGIRFYTDSSNDANCQIAILPASAAIYPDDVYQLDGKSSGIMYKNGVGGNALMADASNNSMLLMENLVRNNTSGRMVYTGDNYVTEWTFHTAGANYYHISAETAAGTKYLKITSSGITLSDTADDSSKIMVSVDNNHQMMLTANGKSIKYDGTSFTVADKNSGSWLDLIDVSDVNVNDKVTYLAKKISVSQPETGDRVVVYTRVWDDIKKEYNFYAIDHDGKLRPCYDRGDNIMWIGNPISTFEWDFTEYTYDDGTPNNYYELQNIYSKLFIAPQVKDGQILSESKIGINMQGRGDNQYFSPIVAWDDHNYAYAGLRAVKHGGDIVLESCPLGDAMDFYFASMQDVVPTLTEVDTIDNKDYGITMKVIDFNDRAQQSNFLGSDKGGAVNTTVAGLLSTNIEEDSKYPVTAFEESEVKTEVREDGSFDHDAYVKGKSLGDLYNGAYEVNNLFIKSTYEATGYFEFDSTQNFATLDQNTKKFKVYKELGTSDIKDYPSMKHGQFLPFDTITAGKYANKNPQNTYDALLNNLPNTDPRKYENLHLINAEKPNYYNGVELEASFVQTPSGKDAWGHDIIFEFTGDDDFWLYVDNELVIDLGGIHSALKGNVNFLTGDVYVNGVTKKLRQVFEENYRSRNPGASATDVNNYLSKYFEDGETVFKDYSSHTMRIFYMERGAGASNLHMKFNLSYVTPGHVVMEKEVTGSEDIDFKLVEYPYQIWYIDDETTQVPKLLTRDDAHISVNYQNSTEKVKYVDLYTPPNCDVSYPSVFFLHPGKPAEIHFPSDAIQYKIIECGINQEVYDHVYVNGKKIESVSIGNSNRRYYDSGWISVAERPSVKFENHVNPENLRTLTFKKRLLDEENHELSMSDDPTLFSFRLYLSNGVDDTLYPAKAANYCVLSPASEGHPSKLCRWDSEKQRFVETEYSEYSEFDILPSDTDEQKAAKKAAKASVTFNTSFNGSISKIPAYYSVIVPNLPVGSRFKVEEKFNETPVGYGRTKYKREDGTYYPDDDGVFENAGRIRANESPRIDITNKRGYGIEVDKVWSDKKYTKSHEPIYFAVYVHNNESDSDELLNGTVRVLKSQEANESYVRYFFEKLLEGHTLADYHVYEVKVTNPGTPDDDGVISTYTSVEKIAPGATTTFGAVPSSSTTGTLQPFDYVVTYKEGTPYPCREDFPYENARTDTVTNTRSDGVVMNLYNMKTGVPLSGGTFTLKKATDAKPLGTFVSDSDGRITILYDFEPDAEYILEETIAPKGYIGLPNKIKFTINDQNIITVDPNGNDPVWQDGEQLDDNPEKLVAKVNVYNKPYNIRVYKYDKNVGEDDGELEGATFALFKGVKSGLGGVIKDSSPMQGYESLITDPDGVIPNINNELEPGRYFLTEIAPPLGYKGVDGDVVFEITEKDGLIHISSPSNSGVVLDETETEDEFVYLLKIPNVKDSVPLTITKTVAGNMGSKVKDFSFTFTTSDGDTKEYAWTKNGEEQTKKLKTGDPFQMRHDDTVVVLVPAGTTVTIAETTEDYTATFKFNDASEVTGDSLQFTVNDASTLAVTNTLTAEIPTGVWISYGFWIIAGALMLAGMLFFRSRARRYSKEK